MNGNQIKFVQRVREVIEYGALDDTSKMALIVEAYREHIQGYDAAEVWDTTEALDNFLKDQDKLIRRISEEIKQ